MNILKFSGVVLEKMGFVFTFFRLTGDGWIMSVQKDKEIICAQTLSTKDIEERYNLNVSKFV